MTKLTLAFKQDPDLYAEFKALLAEKKDAASRRMLTCHDTEWMFRWQGFCQAIDFLVESVDTLIEKTEDNPLNPEPEKDARSRKARRSSRSAIR